MAGKSITHFRKNSETAKTGKAICNQKSKNTRMLARMVTCENCRDIIRYHVNNNANVAEFYGWDIDVLTYYWYGKTKD